MSYLFIAIVFTAIGYWAGAEPGQLKEFFTWVVSKFKK